jgi:hypothetical protein
VLLAAILSRAIGPDDDGKVVVKSGEIVVAKALIA